MAECQSSRVECLTGCQPLDFLSGASSCAGDPPTSPTGVHRIPHDRMTDVLEMDSNLVGAPAVEVQTQQIRHLEASNHTRIGACGTPKRRDRHPLAVDRMTRDRPVDHGRARIQMAPDQCGVGSSHPPRRDRGAEPAMGQIGLGHHHQAGCLPIQPVHDAWPSLGASGKRRPSRDQCIDQSVVPVTRRGMDHQAGRLIDDGEVLILEQDGKRDGIGAEGPRRLVLGKTDGETLATRECPRGSGRFVGHRHRALGDQARRLGAG